MTIKSKIVGILFLTNLISYVCPAKAEIWNCGPKNQATHSYTNTPVRSEGVDCTKVNVADAAVTLIPAESFDNFSSKVEPTAVVLDRKKEPMLAQSITTTWKKMEIQQFNAREPANIFNQGCLIWGEARSSTSGLARVTITRGALTVLEVPLSIPKKAKSVPWELKMRGHCRNPVVAIQIVGN